MNVFHYGFRERTAFIDNHPHGYPPFQLEDRFDQILLPLLSSLAAQHGRSAVPDVFSVTSGFWGMMRQAVEDDRKKEQDVEDGMTEADAAAKWDTWRSMPADVQRWNERRIEEVVKHVGAAWDEAEVRPRILWRALHHIRVSGEVGAGWSGAGQPRAREVGKRRRADPDGLFTAASPDPERSAPVARPNWPRCR